jgi:hypothetical protein
MKDFVNQLDKETRKVDFDSFDIVRRQLSWPVRVNYDGRLGFRILSGSSLF